MKFSWAIRVLVNQPLVPTKKRDNAHQNKSENKEN